MFDYTCEFCGEGGDRYDMATLEPVVECVECADKVAAYWYGQYRAERRDVDLDGGYDMDDPKSEGYLDRLLDMADSR